MEYKADGRIERAQTRKKKKKKKKEEKKLERELLCRDERERKI